MTDALQYVRHEEFQEEIVASSSLSSLLDLVWVQVKLHTGRFKKSVRMFDSHYLG